MIHLVYVWFNLMQQLVALKQQHPISWALKNTSTSAKSSQATTNIFKKTHLFEVPEVSIH
jgi:hypothetical protein